MIGMIFFFNHCELRTSMVHENVEHDVEVIIQPKNKYAAKLETEITSSTKKSLFFCTLKLLVLRQLMYSSISEVQNVERDWRYWVMYDMVWLWWESVSESGVLC